MSKVKVVKFPGHESVVTAFENSPEYGYVGVETSGLGFSGGWLNNQKRVATIKGRMDDLMAFGFAEGQEMPGKIVIRESHEAAYDGHEPKINPSHESVEVADDGTVTYDAGARVLSGGLPVFRTTYYTENLDEKDILLPTDQSQVQADAPAEQNVLAMNG